MQNNIRNTNLRFNLDKDQQRRAWEYLQTMDRQDFKSYSQVISLALVDYFDRYYRTQADPYLENILYDVSPFPSGHGNKRNCQNALYYPARPGKAFPEK